MKEENAVIQKVFTRTLAERFLPGFMFGMVAGVMISSMKDHFMLTALKESAVFGLICGVLTALLIPKSFTGIEPKDRPIRKIPRLKPFPRQVISSREEMEKLDQEFAPTLNSGENQQIEPEEKMIKDIPIQPPVSSDVSGSAETDQRYQFPYHKVEKKVSGFFSKPLLRFAIGYFAGLAIGVIQMLDGKVSWFEAYNEDVRIGVVLGVVLGCLFELTWPDFFAALLNGLLGG